MSLKILWAIPTSCHCRVLSWPIRREPSIRTFRRTITAQVLWLDRGRIRIDPTRNVTRMARRIAAWLWLICSNRPMALPFAPRVVPMDSKILFNSASPIRLIPFVRGLSIREARQQLGTRMDSVRFSTERKFACLRMDNSKTLCAIRITLCHGRDPRKDPFKFTDAQPRRLLSLVRRRVPNRRIPR